LEEEIVKSHLKTFLTCFEDKRPFDRIPRSEKDFRAATQAIPFVTKQKT
jgi:hypothetical protein